MAELTREQQILVALQTANLRLKEQEARRAEPLAIIGMAMRFPGGAHSAEDYWQLLANKRDAIIEVPKERWNIDALYDPDPDAPGKMSTRFGGFLQGMDVAAFDAALFGIAPKEAQSMDPQQRLLLECVWETLEDAGYDPARLAGSRTGVFVGIATSDYDTLLGERGIERVDSYRGTGNAFSAAAGRISYCFGFQGPCLAIDTACSSSLSALHQAELALRNGECDFAVVAGVNLILAPDNTVYFSKGRFMAPDGRCKTFSAEANGYVRGEGAGVILLRRHSDAERDGDRVRALVRAAAVNQDGRSGGLTVPNGPAQESVVRAALALARLNPLDIEYVEAHGTGTPLGDPIEMNALAAVYGAGRNRQSPLLVGSVKTNLGHLEAAAGMASIIKTVLALEHEMIPPQLHFSEPSPKIAWSELPVSVVTDMVPWRRQTAKPRRAGISAFAFQGSNAHVIIEEAPLRARPAVPARDAEVLLVSARTDERLRSLANRLADQLQTTTASFADVCSTLLQHRAIHRVRLTLVAATTAEAVTKLRAFAAKAPVDGLWSEEVLPGARTSTAREPLTLQTAEALAQALADGRVDPRRIEPRPRGAHVSLATDPFDTKRYWFEGAPALRTEDGPLGSKYESVSGRLSFTRRFTAEDAAAFDGHRIYDRAIVPGAALLTWMQQAAQEALRGAAPELTAIVFERALAATANAVVQIEVEPAERGVHISLHSRTDPNEPWTRHATALALHSEQARPSKREDTQSAGLTPHSPQRLYEQFNERGMRYEGAYRATLSLLSDGDLVVSQVEGTDAIALLDASLHGLLTTLDKTASTTSAMMPTGVERFWCTPLPHALTAHAVVRQRSSRHQVSDIVLRDDTGTVVAEVIGLSSQIVEPSSLSKERDLDVSHWLYEERWQPAPLERAATVATQQWIVLGSGDLAASLRARRHAVQHIEAPSELDRCEPAALVWVVEAADETMPLTAGQDVRTLITPRINTALALMQWAAREQQRLTVITREVTAPNANIVHAPIVGMMRSFDNEHPALGSRLIDTLGADAEALCAELESDSNEPEVRLGNERAVLRLSRAERRLVLPVSAENYRLRANGSSEALAFELAARPPPARGEVEVEIRAVGLNFHDVLTSMSAIAVTTHGEDELGADVCGVVTAIGPEVTNLSVGDRVLGLVKGGAIAKYALADARLLTKAPAILSDAEASSLPTLFLTLMYGFAEAGELRRGDRVLVHGAAGGIGLATIQLAKLAGATVFATAGSSEKRAYLQSIGVEHVYDSRSLAFADAIRRDTDGVGVDVVINSVVGEMLDATAKLLVKGGRFIELGRRDVRSAAAIEALAPGARYHVINLAKVSNEQPQRLMPLLEALTNDYTRARLTPMPVTSFPFEAVDQAFSFMARAKHIGKVVVERTPIVRDDRSYLVVGGKRGIGAIAAERLATLGAKHIALFGRSDADEPGAAIIARLRASGVHVLELSGDVGNEASVDQALATIAEALPTLAGVVQSAGVLSDASIENQTAESFERVFAPKVYGSWLLQKKLEGALDFFVFYSSIAAVIGPKGQSTHAAACSFEDALARRMRAHGRAALSIQWGAWSGVGVAAERGAVDRARKVGIEPIDPSAGAQAFEQLLRGSKSHSATSFVSPIKWSAFKAVSDVRLRTTFSEQVETRRATSVDSSFLDQLRSVEGARRKDVMTSAIVREVRTVLGGDASLPIGSDQPLMDLGLDSLMAVDLRTRLGRLVQRQLPATLMFDYPTVDKLVGHLLGQVSALSEHTDQKRPAARTEANNSAPIAVIGLSCRFPGARDADEYWRLLKSGASGISEVPGSRWDIEKYYSADVGEAGKMATRHGGFVHGVDELDAAFFGLTPHEAKHLDPQQRLLLEHAQLALEDAAIDPTTLSGTRTGVFVGVSNVDYARLDVTNAREAHGFLTQMGNTLSFTAGRLSYTFGFQGPSLAIDTACSSSLVALAQAVQALRSGACETALVCGVNLMLAPGASITLSEMGTQAPDGQCKTFDDDANGFVRAEGCGVVVLQRLQDAKNNGARIRAIVRGVAVNQDGRSSGITAPNGPAQQAMITQAIADAAIASDEVSYVEAHGTGTALGDPIEIESLAATYGKARARHAPLLVGSVKTNIGHAESAAGVAGLIKLILMLEHEEIAPHRNLRRLSKHIAWPDLSLCITSKNEQWPRGKRPRLAALSSFGISGTNAHAIIEEAPAASAERKPTRPQHLLTLSAKSAEALAALERDYLHFLRTTDASAADIAFSTNVGRAHHAYRSAFVGADKEAWAQQLAAPRKHGARMTTPPRLALVLPPHAQAAPSLFASASVTEGLTSLGLEPEWIAEQSASAPAEATLVITLPAELDWKTILDAVARFYVAGGRVSFEALHRAHAGKRVALPTYPFERRRYWLDSNAPPREDWLYVNEWHPVAPAEREKPQSWLVLGSSQVARELEQLGHTASSIADVGELEQAPKRALVWVVQAPTCANASAVQRCVQGLTQQALQVSKWAVAHRAELTVVLRGESDFHGMVQGLMRSLDNEHEELGCRVITDPSSDTARLAMAIEGPRTEPELRVKGPSLLAPRLAAQEAPQTPAKLRADRSYLVVGGKRGIGALSAERLVALGARHVAVLGRSPPDAHGALCLERMRAQGATVLELTADVADEAALDTALQTLASEAPPLAGVIHSAAVIADAAVENQNEATFARVLAPKVMGTWLLTNKLPLGSLDFFVMYSSVASALGSKGQTNYAAACGFQDAVAQSLHARGINACSLQWGVWSDVGAAAARGIVHRAASVGLLELSPEAGLSALERLLTAPRTANLVVSRIDWKAFSAVGERRLRSVFSRFTAEAGNEVSLVARLRATPVKEHRALVTQAVTEALSVALGHDHIPPTKAFSELGMDSLSASTLRRRFEKLIEKPIAITAIFEHQTVAQLTDFLLAQLAVGRDDAHAAPSSSTLSADVLALRSSIASSGAELMTLRSEGSGMPVVFFPPAGGACFEYQPLAQKLLGHPVYACQDYHTFSASGHFETVEESAEYYMWLLRRSGITTPFIAAGWSLGGSIAYDVAQRIARNTGETIPVLLLEPAPNGIVLQSTLALRLGLIALLVRGTKSQGLLKWILRKAGTSDDRARVFQAIGMVAPNLDARTIAKIVLGNDSDLPASQTAILDHVYAAIREEAANNIDFWPGASPKETLSRSNLLVRHQQVAVAYRPKPYYAGPLFLVLAQEGSFSQRWREALLPRHSVAAFAAKGWGGEGAHTLFMKPANVELYADAVNEWLSTLSSPASPQK